MVALMAESKAVKMDASRAVHWAVHWAALMVETLVVDSGAL